MVQFLAGIEHDWAVDFTDHPLYVHKVENIKEAKTTSGGPTQSALTYRLHFCSPELLRSNRVRVSRTLQGTYSDIVKNILKNDLKTTKEFETKETEDLKLVKDLEQLKKELDTTIDKANNMYVEQNMIIRQQKEKINNQDTI